MNSPRTPRILPWLASALALAALPFTRAADLVPVTMQLDWKPNVQFAGLVVAVEKGYYREAGLDVRLRPVDTGRWRRWRPGRTGWAVPSRGC